MKPVQPFHQLRFFTCPERSHPAQLTQLATLAQPLRLILAILGSVVLGCTMYDDSLLTGSAHGGTAGRAQGGSAHGGTSLPKSSGATTPTSLGCAGEMLGEICWYLSETGASCSATCSLRGGTNDAASTWVGVTAQGGSLAKCASLLELLGVSLAPVEAYRTDGRGLGCMTYQGNPFWHRSPAFSASASMPDARLACGCVR
jgi:hypothetical protein